MKYRLLVILFSLSLFRLQAQDAQFSQYYAAPLILNPAMTGLTECVRAGVNVRTQWSFLPGGAFNTAAVYADAYKPEISSGLGILVVHDAMGNSRISSNEISGLYSYQLSVTERVSIRAGLQATYVSRNVTYSSFRFPDQYTGTSVTSQSTVDPVTGYPSVSFADFSSGLVLYEESKYWIGFSIHHINRPRQNFYTTESKLSKKYSLHGGYNFYTEKKYGKPSGVQITPTFLYKAQGKFDQLDLGIYFIKDIFQIGAWYRGIPIKTDEGYHNSDAFSVHAGLLIRNLAFIYSYDFTTSRLAIRNTKGSHEISMRYEFCIKKSGRNKRPARRVRKLPCPDFQRR